MPSRSRVEDGRCKQGYRSAVQKTRPEPSRDRGHRIAIIVVQRFISIAALRAAFGVSHGRDTAYRIG